MGFRKQAPSVPERSVRWMVLAGLLVAMLAVAAGVGMPYGRLDWVTLAQPYLPPPPPVPTGTLPPPPTVPRKIRLYADARQREILFEIEIAPGTLLPAADQVQNGGVTVYDGPSALSRSILFFDGETVFQGGNTQGPRLFTVDQRTHRVYAGPNNKGPLVYTLEIRTHRIRQGSRKGPILFTISDDKLHAGPNNTGQVIFFSNTNLERIGPIQFLLPILAEGRFH